MKNTSKILTLFTIFVVVLNGNAQTTNTFPTSGDAGIGITSPNANLHIYGTSDYFTGGGGGPKSLINHGKTARILLNNSTTGNGVVKGLEIRMSDDKAVINNHENGLMELKSGISLYLDGSQTRASLGFYSSDDSRYARFSVLSSGDNGFFVRTTSTGKYGIRTSVVNANDNALEVVVGNASTPEKNFTVTGGGNVFARKYTTTLANIPDYVFEPTYELMPLDALATYIELNKHLPNVPSATEYEKEGVDLGEMNRLLLEKVEELTLYVLQLNKEINILKEGQQETPIEHNTSDDK